MLKIDYYEDKGKKLDGRHYCCAYVNTEDINGYSSVDQIETRCATYEDAKKELLEHVRKLRDELSDLLKKEAQNENM